MTAVHKKSSTGNVRLRSLPQWQHSAPKGATLKCMRAFIYRINCHRTPHIYTPPTHPFCTAHHPTTTSTFPWPFSSPPPRFLHLPFLNRLPYPTSTSTSTTKHKLLNYYRHSKNVYVQYVALPAPATPPNLPSKQKSNQSTTLY